MMKSYRYLLLDADNTLFDFNRAEEAAFHAAFSALGLFADAEIYARYHEINDELWRKLEKKEVTRDRLKTLRFELLFAEIGIDVSKAEEISRLFFHLLARQRFLLDGAIDVSRVLSEKYSLYIVTNGSYFTQCSRFSGSGLEPYFRAVYISEQIGVEKPSALYYDHVFKNIGDEDPSHYLVIGDSLTSDIDGAIGMGMDCVWLDHKGKGDTRGRDIPYIIKDIRELPALLDQITK